MQIPFALYCKYKCLRNSTKMRNVNISQKYENVAMQLENLKILSKSQ